jgi:hypothetical protein
MLGAAGRLPVGDRGLEFLNQAESWQKVEDRKIGADRLSVYRRTGRFVQESSA